MVTLKGKKYGIDFSDGMVSLASQTYAHGRERVEALLAIPSEQLRPDLIESDGELFLAIPENESVIKRINIVSDYGLNPGKLAVFELSSSLLIDQSHYYLESFGREGSSERLAIAYNRDAVDKRIDFLKEVLARPTGFKLRSWALAAGYRHFCRREGGQLIGLVDISSNLASFCFLRDDYPVEIGAVMADPASVNNGGNLSKAFLLDLVATLQYRRMALDRTFHSLPLSMLVITGERTNQNLVEKLGEAMGVRAVLPVIKKELFSESSGEQAGKFLVALGLMVE
nr:hypothetical protein [candidate division Zixibacteria bacterium]